MAVRLTSPGAITSHHLPQNPHESICPNSGVLTHYRGHSVQRNVKLSNVIECAIHKLCLELQKMIDILPSRSLVDKKVDIALFLGRARHLFIRLLALIKWANSAPKIDKCEKIMNQLNYQSMVLLDTANFLSRMAKETLVSARLPPFAVVLATDILTEKTYTRLPACIGKSIVNSNDIKKWDKLEAICSTNRHIEYRLSSVTLPLHMRDVVIENGRAIFTVPNEFQISLTLMADVLDFPWRILGIRILVRDPVVGRARPLLHPSQIQYLQDQLQARILFRNVEKKSPLQQIYEMLHYFCLNLQLDILYEQAQLLVKQQPESLLMEPYQIGCPLLVRYWQARNYFSESFAVCISINHLEKRSRLQVHHSPPLNEQDMNDLGSTVETCSPSFELLLHKAIRISSRELLKGLKSILLRYSAGPVYLNHDTLRVTLLSPCLLNEYLMIHLSHLHGTFQATLFDEETSNNFHSEETVSLNNILRDLNNQLNQNLSSVSHHKLNTTFSRLRLWLGRRRVVQCLSYLPHCVACTLGFTDCPQDHSAAKLIQNLSHTDEEKFLPVVYVKLVNHAEYYLVIELFSDGLQINYSFSVMTATSYVNKIPSLRVNKSMFLKAVSMVTLDINKIQSSTSGSEIGNIVRDIVSYRQLTSSRKRNSVQRMLSSIRSSYDDDYDMEMNSPASKYRRLKYGSQASGDHILQMNRLDFLTVIPKIIAFAQETVAMTILSDQMKKLGIENSGFTLEESCPIACLQIFRFPTFHHKLLPADMPASRTLIGLTESLRIYKQINQVWSAQLMLSACPMGKLCAQTSDCRALTQLYTWDRLKCLLQQQHYRIGGLGELKNFTSTLLHYIDLDWKQMQVIRALLYQIEDDLPVGVRILKCSDLQSITFAYGPNNCYRVRVSYKLLESRFDLHFFTNSEVFSELSTDDSSFPSSTTNPHSIMVEQFENILNTTNSLPHFLTALVETLNFASIVFKLNDSTLIFHCNHDNPGQIMRLKSIQFSSVYDLRLIYCNMFCIRISLIRQKCSDQTSEFLVEIQDDFSYLQFQRLTVLENYLETALVNKSFDDFKDRLKLMISLEDLHRLVVSSPSSFDTYLLSSLSFRVLENTLLLDPSLLIVQPASHGQRIPRLHMLQCESPDQCISISSPVGKLDFRLLRNDTNPSSNLWNLRLNSRENNKDLEILDNFFNTQVMRDDCIPCAASVISFVRLLTIPQRALIDLLEFLTRTEHVKLNLCSMLDPLISGLFSSGVPTYGQPAIFIRDNALYLQISVSARQSQNSVHVYILYDYQSKTISHLSLSSIDKTTAKLELVKQYQLFFKNCGKKWDSRKTSSQSHEDSPFIHYFDYVSKTYSNK